MTFGVVRNMIGASPAEVIGHITCQHRIVLSHPEILALCRVSVLQIALVMNHVVILWYLELSV